MATDHHPEIIVRRMRFEFPDGIDPVVVDGQPEESFTNVALSLLLPYLEPYLIRSMRQARPQVVDASLVADLDLFNAQEAQHFKQHIAFNEAVRLPESSRVRELEAELDADYKRFTKERSLRWNLAYAEGFEAYTLALARFSFESGLLDRMRPPVSDLYRWHLIEEMEHRTVAFDVYDHVCGGYLYRLIIGLYAQWHLNRFLLRSARAMVDADPVAFKAKYGGIFQAWRRQSPLLGRMLLGLLPKILATYLPWYSPHRLRMPDNAKELGDHYAELAETRAKGAASAE